MYIHGYSNTPQAKRDYDEAQQVEIQKLKAKADFANRASGRWNAIAIGNLVALATTGLFPYHGYDESFCRYLCETGLMGTAVFSVGASLSNLATSLKATSKRFELESKILEAKIK